MKSYKKGMIYILLLLTIEAIGLQSIYAQITAGDCSAAVPVCTNQNFQISPNGFGNINELNAGTFSNPNVNPASGNMGCLLTGEQNSTWVLINISQTGTLMFSFGNPGPVQCFDWIMWPYTPNTCSQIMNNTIAPLRCNWNSPCNSFTGMASAPLPTGGLASNFEPPLQVNCGDQYLICFSNYSSAVTSVPLNFFGTAIVSCTSVTPLTISASPTQICSGGSTTLTSSGGTNYTWSPPTGLSGTTGNQVVANPTVTTTYTVTAQNGCGLVSQSVVVTVIPAPVISINITDPTICLPCNGAASVTVTGGQQPILYSWSPTGGNNPIANGLCPDTYNVTVNAGGCVSTLTFVLPEPYLIAGTLTATPEDCGMLNGTATITNITGAISPYTLTWNTTPVQSTTSITGLASGNYTVTIIDANNCRKDTAILVPLNSTLTVTSTSTPLSCPHSTDGTASVTPLQGTPPYIITWNTVPPQNGPTATGLGFGNFIATITDADNCSLTRLVQIIRPPGISLSSTYNAVSCFGASDGAISTVPSNGNAPYTFLWNTSPVQTTSVVTGLPIGTYSVIVTDNTNCWERDTVILTQPPALNPTVTYTQPTCNGNLNATATVQIPPNLLNITFAWSTIPVQTTQTATGLSVGSYAVYVTNRTGCQDTAYVTILQPPILTGTTTFVPASCLGASNGTATVFPSGGTSPYSVSWLTQPVQNGFTAYNLPAGTWQAVVSDTNACRDTLTVVVGELHDSIPLFIQTTLVSCPGATNGTATVQVVNGSGVYQYQWFTQPVQNTPQATGLSAGSYRIQVVNSAGCVGNAWAHVGLVPPMIVQGYVNAVSCFGGSNGNIGVQVQYGSPGYQYVWNTSPVQNTHLATGLSAGTWRLIVSDAAGCRDTSFWPITEPMRLSASTSDSPALCYGQANGSSLGTATGGVPPYTWSWNSIPVQTTQLASGLGAGIHVLTVQDQNQCVVTTQAQIQQPQNILIAMSYTLPLCYGDNTGEMLAQVSGGVAPYTYLWNNGQTTALATGLYSSTWIVQVMDAHACPASASHFLPQPTELALNMSGIDLTCALPPDNGIVSVFTSGGSPPYTYQWNGGGQPTQAWNTGLPAGVWTVVVKDRNDCMRTDSVAVFAPELPIAHTYADTFKCAGIGQVPLGGWGSGGAGGYSYLWLPNDGSLSDAFTPFPVANPDSTTTYFLQVVDSAGCRSPLIPQQVIVHPLPIADAGADLLYCKDGPAVFLEGSIANPQGAYTVQWYPVAGLFCDTCLTTYASPDTSRIYTLRVTSRLTGCSSDSTTLNTLSSILVEVRPRPVADAGPDTSICYGDQAALCGIASGAGPVYNYFWSSGSIITNPSAQCTQVAPPHTSVVFLVVESNGCLSPADSVTVFVSALPQVDAGNIKNICEGDSIQLDGSIQQGIAQQYEWQPSTGLNASGLLQPLASPSATQWYFLRGINAGCAGAWDSVEVVVHSVPQADAGNDTLICDYKGAALLQGNYTGGNPPVSLIWSPAQGLSQTNILNPVAQPLVSTLYYLKVSSGTGQTLCTTTDSILVTVLPSPHAVIQTDTNQLCAGMNLDLKGSGGQGSASYQWYDVSGMLGNTVSIEVQAQQTNTYSLIVSEGICRDTAEVFIKVFPMPDAAFISSQPKGCKEMKVQFNDLSTHGYSYIWNFGDGSKFSNEKNPAHIYTQSGSFNVVLVLQGLGGCRDTFYSDVHIKLMPEIQVRAFSDPEPPVEWVLPMSPMYWKAESVQDPEYFWDFGDGSFAQGKTVEHAYTKPGIYYVSLEALDDQECQTSVRLGPYIIVEPVLEIPNVFTPNGDGINDIFKVEHIGDELFSLYIYDRWGVLQYETHNKEAGWDGRDLNGNPTMEGTYFYRVEAGGGSYSGYVVLMK